MVLTRVTRMICIRLSKLKPASLQDSRSKLKLKEKGKYLVCVLSFLMIAWLPSLSGVDTITHFIARAYLYIDRPSWARVKFQICSIQWVLRIKFQK